MLGKLIKYDMRSCWKTFCPFWLAILVLSVINGFSVRYSGESEAAGFLVSVLPLMLLFGTCLILFVVAIVYICQEFYDGLLGKSGYLMFTLPVKTGSLIASKGIVALILECISALVLILCGILIVLSLNNASGFELLRVIPQAFREYPVLWKGVLLFFEALLLALAWAVAFNERIHVSIALGHLAKKNRVFLSFVAYVVIGGLNSFLGIRTMALIDRFFPNFEINPSMTGKMTLLLLGLTVWELLLSSVYFFITNWVLKHHLNLE